MYRWILDTNIIISGLFWSGKENKLLELAVAEEYKAIICEFVLQETKRVIENKFPEMENKAEVSLNLLVKSAKVQPFLPAQELNQFIYNWNLDIELSKGDLIILATAANSKAEAIITGDQDFHESEIKEIIEIISADQALQKLDR